MDGSGMGRHNHGRTLWKTENKSNKFYILQKHCERQESIAKHFKRPCKRAQELLALLSSPNLTLLWETCLVLPIFSIRNLKDFQGVCHCLEEAVLGERTVVACMGKIILIPCCSWTLRMGDSPFLLNVQVMQHHWERPGQLAVLSSTVSGTLHCLLLFTDLLHAQLSAFILTLMERKKE